MSLCDRHGEGQNGKICSFYVTLVRSGIRYTKRLRCCSQCVENIQHTYADQWSDGFILTKFNAESACVGCGELRGDNGVLHPLYATGYSKRDQRHDYFAAYCDSCSDTVIGSFSLEVSTVNASG